MNVYEEGDHLRGNVVRSPHGKTNMRIHAFGTGHSSGFTLMELIVVVAGFAVLTSIAVPSVFSWLPSYRLNLASRTLFSHIQLAKLTAIRERCNCTVTFGQSVGGITSDYIVFIDGDNDLEYDTGEQVIRSVSLNRDYPGVEFDVSMGGGGISFTDNDEGHPSVAFRPNGLTRNNAGGFGAGTVFLINSQGKTGRVVVSSAGMVRLN